MRACRDQGASTPFADNGLPSQNSEMVSIRPSTSDDGERVVEIWRRAVDATHDFLTPADRTAIDEMVSALLPAAALWLAIDHDKRPVGFMLLVNGHMEALFVDPEFHGRGVGASLVRHGVSLSPTMTTDVNEQNTQAVGFYERMGFRRTGYSPLDGQGKCYPLIHLRYSAKAADC